MSERKLVRRSVAIALGMICVFLVVGVVIAVAVYNSSARALNSQLSSLESQISSLRAQIADMQAHGLVVVEGRIYGPRVYLPEGMPPWDYDLDSNGTTIGISWDGGDFFNWTSVRVYGIVTQGTLSGGLTEPPGTVQYIKALRIELL